MANRMRNRYFSGMRAEGSRRSVMLQPLLMALLAICCGRVETRQHLNVTASHPRCVPADRATRITITGDGFQKGDRVMFGRLAGANVAVPGAKQIVADAPAGAGSIQITVIAPDGERRTVVNALTYQPPQTFDPNGDCRVDATDVFYLSQYLRGAGAPPVLSADANGDGKVDQRDLDFLI